MKAVLLFYTEYTFKYNAVWIYSSVSFSEVLNIDLNIILYGYTGFAYICNFAAFGVMMCASHSRNDEIKFKLTRS